MTSTFWPMSHSAASCILPEELLKASKSFEQFYFSKHTGRRLTWQPSLGNADVRVTFNARKHDLNVSTFALVILLLFENVADGDTLSYSVSRMFSLNESCSNRRYRTLKRRPTFKILSYNATCNLWHVQSSRS